MKIECPRCSGKGRIDAYNHIAAGICFLCLGKKQVFIKDLVFTGKEHITLAYHDQRNLKDEDEKYKIEFITMVCNEMTDRGHEVTTWSKQWILSESTDRNQLRNLWKHGKQQGWEVKELR